MKDVTLVKLKYVGRADIFSCEFNGKKYSFSTKNRVKIIPLEAYLSIITSRHVRAQDVIPYTTPEDQKAFRLELLGLPKETQEEKPKLNEERTFGKLKKRSRK